MTKVIKFIFFILTALQLTSCQAEDDYFGASEKQFQEKQRETLVLYMSLEEMFEDESVRALAKAAGKGQISNIQKIIESGVAVDSKGKGDATPLFWAFRNNNFKGFAKLLELGADPNHILQGGSMMNWLAQYRDIHFLELALKHGGDPNRLSGRERISPLFTTLYRDKEDALKLLIDNGADINTISGQYEKYGSQFGKETPMMYAMSIDKYDFALILLENGADPFIADIRGNTILAIIEKNEPFLRVGSESYKTIQKIKNKIDKIK